jgi:hypothetical protein
MKALVVVQIRTKQKSVADSLMNSGWLYTNLQAFTFVHNLLRRLQRIRKCLKNTALPRVIQQDDAIVHIISDE